MSEDSDLLCVHNSSPAWTPRVTVVQIWTGSLPLLFDFFKLDRDVKIWKVRLRPQAFLLHVLQWIAGCILSLAIVSLRTDA